MQGRDPLGGAPNAAFQHTYRAIWIPRSAASMGILTLPPGQMTQQGPRGCGVAVAPAPPAEARLPPRGATPMQRYDELDVAHEPGRPVHIFRSEASR